MEQLYPQNIIERRYPILREQREKAEREAMAEKRRLTEGVTKYLEELEEVLYENVPSKEGNVGKHLNTLA